MQIKHCVPRQTTHNHGPLLLHTLTHVCHKQIYLHLAVHSGEYHRSATATRTQPKDSTQTKDADKNSSILPTQERRQLYPL